MLHLTLAIKNLSGFNFFLALWAIPFQYIDKCMRVQLKDRDTPGLMQPAPTVQASARWAIKGTLSRARALLLQLSRLLQLRYVRAIASACYTRSSSWLRYSNRVFIASYAALAT